ncbi:hypothetical protein [Ramlibacter rhizophilus]|uniref:Uncharacterized protein n=1 Tax=Ramlibacter rhizophilus TaxID=1781167 RepID=A0A4Z0C070_9BURK|nr:hypothetical protein [Ramlibacter rhizophilus]TFZ04923.1 hypothetical protein EZ242_04025 [Ramlibacter rhizophilus]
MDASQPLDSPPAGASRRAPKAWPVHGTAPEVAISPGMLIRIIVAVFVVLLALHLLAVSSYLLEWRFPARDKFYMDAENNIPTVFSTLLLLTASLLCAWATTVERHRRSRFSWHWAGLALAMLALGIDEAAALHELLINPIQKVYQTTGWLRFPWVIAGIPLVLLFAFAYLRFLAALPARTRWGFIAAGALYVGGALGMEMVGGQVFQEAGTPDRTLVPYMIAMTVEESCEMLGVTAFIATLLAYLRGTGVALRMGSAVPVSGPRVQ